MERRAFMVGGVAALAAPRAARAQQARKMPRVGFLSYVSPCDGPLPMIPFREGLRALGYVEGQNILLECRGGPHTRDRLHDLVAEMLGLNVDVIVTEGTALSLGAKQATRTIPIVMVYVADPVGSGLVTSLARPGTNVTGLSVLSPGVVQKSLEILREIVPRASRIAVWTDSSNPGQRLLDEQMEAASRILGMAQHRVDVRSAAKLDGAFAATLEQRAEALFVYPLPIPAADRQRIVEFSIKNRLPTATITPLYAEVGMLFAYGVRGSEQYRRVGTYVDRILRGAKPDDLPVEQPAKFDLIINFKTARALGLTVPQSVLLRADQVVE
jgi:putative ABC transport system substrate-binding protein